jgi:hypothetical protein
LLTVEARHKASPTHLTASLERPQRAQEIAPGERLLLARNRAPEGDSRTLQELACHHLDRRSRIEVAAQ